MVLEPAPGLKHKAIGEGVSNIQMIPYNNSDIPYRDLGQLMSVTE
jgi:hypothetical protein